jgi:hypothetical protein
VSQSQICDLWFVTAQMWNAFFVWLDTNWFFSRKNNNQQYQKTSVQKTAEIGLWPGQGQQLR